MPLFSIRREGDWGIGDIGSLAPFAKWVRSAGQQVVQILPVFELPSGETSPYGALSAFAIDPIYIEVERIPGVDAALIANALGTLGANELGQLRKGKTVDYPAIRRLKSRILVMAYEQFIAHQRGRSNESDRELARALASFIAGEPSWLEIYSTFRELRNQNEESPWWEWPHDTRVPTHQLLAQVQGSSTGPMFHVWTQWVLHEQWQAMRTELRALGVELMGDLPFVVTRDSADVWGNQAEFLPFHSLGVPPDDFSADGQDWGLPPFSMEAMRANDFSWLRARTRRMAQLFDSFRADHVVGYFRQWIRETQGAGRRYFDIEGDDVQRARGRRILEVFIQEAGLPAIIAEDLGVIPPYVRHTMAELGVPGYRVLPWERDNGQYRNPQQFSECSVVTWSTHDTAPITAWWNQFEPWERERLSAMMGVGAEMQPRERDFILLRWLYNARSALALTLIQELLGDTSRINLPGSVGSHNWTYRMPQTLEALSRDSAISERLEAIRRSVSASGRV